MAYQTQPNTPAQVEFALASSEKIEASTGSPLIADQHFDDTMSIGATIIPNVMDDIRWVMEELERLNIDWNIGDQFLDSLAKQCLFGNSLAVRQAFCERFGQTVVVLGGQRFTRVLKPDGSEYVAYDQDLVAYPHEARQVFESLAG